MPNESTFWTDSIKASLEVTLQKCQKLPANETLKPEKLNEVLDLLDKVRNTFLLQCELQGFKLERKKHTMNTELTPNQVAQLKTFTPDQVSRLQTLLSELAHKICEFEHANRDIPCTLSYHICPDAGWVSIEHEKPASGDRVSGDVIRIPTSCHIIVTKL